MDIRLFSGGNNMMVLVSYDVAVTSEGGQKRLRRVAKTCTNYGQRVQFSVFECLVEPAQWVQLKTTLEQIIDSNTDSLRYYYLGANYKRRIEHVGAKPVFDLEGLLMV
jgi:CRISPR-associated protein Cas2